jgi:hypothetical protein
MLATVNFLEHKRPERSAADLEEAVGREWRRCWLDAANCCWLLHACLALQLRSFALKKGDVQLQHDREDVEYLFLSTRILLI